MFLGPFSSLTWMLLVLKQKNLEKSKEQKTVS